MWIAFRIFVCANVLLKSKFDRELRNLSDLPFFFFSTYISIFFCVVQPFYGIHRRSHRFLPIQINLPLLDCIHRVLSTLNSQTTQTKTVTSVSICLSVHLSILCTCYIWVHRGMTFFFFLVWINRTWGFCKLNFEKKRMHTICTRFDLGNMSIVDSIHWNGNTKKKKKKKMKMQIICVNGNW